MIIDLNADDVPDFVEADVCVVGAGAAGIVLADDLAARNFRVVLLETGGREHEEDIRSLHAAACVGLPHLGVNDGRFHVLGGSTTKWIGQMLPLDPIDFEARPWIEGSGWPLSHSDMAPYYERALEAAGLGLCLRTDDEVWKRAGLEAPRLGEGLEPYLSRWCPQPDFADLNRQKLERSENLKCVLHATVTGFAAPDGYVRHAIARNFRGRSLELRARHFVICVGGIETPRLLLQPLADGRPAPWSDLDSIGRFFQDHLFGAIGDIVPRNRAELHDMFDKIYLEGFKYHPRFKLGEGVQRRFQLLGAGGLVMFETGKLDLVNQTREACRAIWQHGFDASASIRLLTGLMQGGPTIARLLWRGLIEGRAYNPDDLGVRLTIQLEQAPRPDSRITLGEETDALGVRRAKLDWRLGRAEVDTMAAFAKIVASAFEATGLARVEIYPEVAARSPDALGRVRDFNHHCGTARMAGSKATGVVDPDLRVFGTENLYVCGSAVFPTSGVANPTHTIIALALRLANYLGNRLARA